MKTLQLFYECWLEVTKQNRYRDKWLTDETYFRAIKAQFPTVESLGFDRSMTDERDVVELLEQRIEWLQQVNRTRDSYCR